jgi:hypothetical protein
MTQQETPRHKRLLDALEAFSQSPRFSLFKSVQVGRLVPEGCDHLAGIGENTFEELLGQVRSGGAVDDSLTSEQEETLFHLVSVLSEDAGTATLAPDDDISVVIPDSFTSIDIPTLDEQLKQQAGVETEEAPDDVPVGSVPLELALRASLTQIAAHKRYHEVQRRKIGEFWDPQWTAAPFEESMSIDQLLSLDLAVLFKKRMVTDSRIQSILRALKRVLAHLDDEQDQGESYTSTQSLKDSTLRPHTRSNYGDTTRATCVSVESLSVAAVAIIEVLFDDTREHSLVTELRNKFTPAKFAAIILGEELSAKDERALSRALNRAIDPQALEVARALLAAPAVRIEQIAAGLFGVTTKFTAFNRCVAALVARGLGAVPVALGGAGDGELWTAYPGPVKQAARKVRRSLTAGRGLTKSARVTVSIDITALFSLASSLHIQTQGQEKGREKRKGLRNRLNTRRRRGK